MTTQQAAGPAGHRRPALRGAAWAGVAAVALMFAAEAGRVTFGSNVHEVLPGRVYRCAQPSGPALEKLIRAHGIRTVVNLRGGNVLAPWYWEESRATHRLDVNQEDVCFSASRLPSVHEVRRLVEVLERTEYPILIHCRQGADRTGLASAVALLLLTDASLPEARHQLGLRYGHFAVGRAGYLDRLLRQYAKWLKTEGETHGRLAFRRWITQHYCPGGFRGSLEPLDVPAALVRNRPATLRFRAHNTGTAPWHLRPDNNAGVHAGFIVWDERGHKVADGRSALYEGVVPPGASMDVTLILPSWLAAGTHYHVLVDLVEEQQFWFFQTGSEPWEGEFEPREQDRTAGGERDPARLARLAH